MRKYLAQLWAKQNKTLKILVSSTQIIHLQGKSPSSVDQMGDVRLFKKDFWCIYFFKNKKK